MGSRSVAWVLVGCLVVVTIVAAIAGSRGLPRELTDPRRSIHLWGPNGLSGLAEGLDRLGIPVVSWERPITRVPLDQATDGAWLGLLDIGATLNDLDISRALDWLERGGGVLIGGASPVAECLGYQRSFGRRSEMEDKRLPATPMAWKPISRVERRMNELRPFERRCQGRGWRPESAFALRNAREDTVVALVRLAGGGRALLLADVGFLSNEALRETEAGEVMLPLFLSQRPSRLIVDEYDQGFGARPSIYGTAWSWLVRTPAGWAMLHLALAGVVWLGVSAVRFGPALEAVERRRRSALEHVDALGTGLERANAARTAIGLVAGGLRRRLGRAGTRRHAGVTDDWIASLVLSARSEEARSAVQRLRRIIDRGDNQEEVLAAANAVEDVWEALRPDQSSKTS